MKLVISRWFVVDKSLMWNANSHDILETLFTIEIRFMLPPLKMLAPWNSHFPLKSAIMWISFAKDTLSDQKQDSERINLNNLIWYPLQIINNLFLQNNTGIIILGRKIHILITITVAFVLFCFVLFESPADAGGAWNWPCCWPFPLDFTGSIFSISPKGPPSPLSGSTTYCL